jgi:tetratricopeptide (TPR) repeat protein
MSVRTTHCSSTASTEVATTAAFTRPSSALARSVVIGRAAAAVAVVALLLAARPAVADAPPPPAASSATSTLDQALAAYRSAQETSVAADRPAAFARAERLFSAAAAEGPASAELWTNIGTSALQADHLGTAVLAYRRALALDPDNRHAQQNLAHARTLLPSWVPRHEGGGFLDGFLAWQHAMSAGERRGAGALAFFVALAMLGAAFATGSGALRLFAFVPMVAWGLLLASGVAGASERGGVIASAETIARAADSRNAPARFAEALPAGTEVTIAEVRGEWARVVLADGRDAWVNAAAVDSVDPDAARK